MKKSELRDAFIRLALRTNKNLVRSDFRLSGTKFIIQEIQNMWLGFELGYNFITNQVLKGIDMRKDKKEPKVVHVNSANLSAVYGGIAYKVLLIHSNEQWEHEQSFTQLKLAISKIQEFIHHGQIDLNQWTKCDVPYNPVFLVPSYNHSPRKIHLWNGIDTICTQFSQNGMKINEYILSDEIPINKAICKNCIIHLGFNKTQIEYRFNDDKLISAIRK